MHAVDASKKEITPDISGLITKVDFLKSRLSSAPVVGSSERTAMLLQIMEIQKRILAIRECALLSETTPTV